jgi:hypothetical protein
MSPGHRTERIYALLKAQIMRGERREPERLDPARLAAELDVSATPVRDALHQLFGERLVEAWPREGFKVPVLGESDLADLYRWNGDIAGMVLRGTRPPLGAPPPLARHDASNPADRARAFFAALAAWLGNGEHVAAMALASDRLNRARLAEAAVLADGDGELAALTESLARGALGELRTGVAGYHRRRQRHARQILAAMRTAAPEE